MTDMNLGKMKLREFFGGLTWVQIAALLGVVSTLLMHIPGHAGRLFQSMSATHSGLMPATDSGACRPPLIEGV